MPTFEEFLLVYKDTPTLVNIELKGPISLDKKSLYDFQRAAETVHNMVLFYQMQH